MTNPVQSGDLGASADADPHRVAETPVLDLVKRLQAIGGCSDGDCKVAPRLGMHTNGGCRCLTDRLTAQRVVGAYMQFVGRDTLRAAAKSLAAKATGETND